MSYSPTPKIVLSAPGDTDLQISVVKPSRRNQHELNQHIEAMLVNRNGTSAFNQEEKELLRRYSGSGGQGTA
jgi:hypothetical protein